MFTESQNLMSHCIVIYKMLRQVFTQVYVMLSLLDPTLKIIAPAIRWSIKLISFLRDLMLLLDCPTRLEMRIHSENREWMCFCIKHDFVQWQNIVRSKKKVQIFQCLRLHVNKFHFGGRIPARNSPLSLV